MINNDEIRIKFHLTNNYLSCDTCLRYDKLIRLCDFCKPEQEEYINKKATHLIVNHGFNI